MEKDGARGRLSCAVNARNPASRDAARVVSILSHVAAIVGTIVAAVDALRHW